MKIGFLQRTNDLDEVGRPNGGVVVGTGFTIAWQAGPLGRGEDRKAPNGAFVEDVIEAAKQRIEHYQEYFPCGENEVALNHLGLALEALNSRTAEREARGVEGTHVA